MILPRTSGLYATSTAIFIPLSPHEMNEMEKMGVFEEERRIYQTEYLSKVFQVECSVFVRSSSSESGVLLSSVKLPYRRYPSHVYLFALLLTFIGLSMRTAAGRIRSLFGISKFSHSTISRDTDRMNTEITRLSAWQPEESEMGYEVQNELPQPRPGALHQALRGTTAGSPGHGLLTTCVPPRFWRKPRPGLCECLFRLLTPMLQTIEYGNRLVFAFGQRFGRLLL
jgi:hypothetical protein